MTHAASHTALLVFTRNEQEEAQAKHFTAIDSLNRKIAAQLIGHTLKEAQKSELPLYVSYSHEQQGADFGERLTHAMQAIFAKGHQHVIVIGNDCLEVDAALLQQTANDLEHSDMVLGPAKDGGTYLIGMTQDAFKASTFQNFSWQSATLFQDFEAYAQEQTLSLQVLEVATDIDHASDLATAVRQSIRPIALWLKNLLASMYITPEVYQATMRLMSLNSSLTFRGPPTSLPLPTLYAWW